jgi:uroporphyrinogen decarboxylase
VRLAELRDSRSAFPIPPIEGLMNSRELFLEIMFYGDFDRVPVWHWTGWPETEAEWSDEFERRGLPRHTNRHEFFRAEGLPWGVPIHLGLYPPFPQETIEETTDYRIFRQADGVIAQHWKGRSCIPHYVDFLFKDRSGWEEYRKRLQPHADRIPKDIDAVAARMAQHPGPRSISTASMVGWLRDWMGVVNFSYLQHDDRDLLREVVATISDLVCWGIDQVLPRIPVEMGWGWEDICGSSGPLITPDVFETCVVPGYRKVADKLREHGVQLYVVDSDGLIEDLVPGWIAGGVNVLFPVQIQPFGADPHAFRRRWGRHLRIIGGVDKLVLTKDAASIADEIERRLPLMRDGGYIPLPDHLIVPGTPLDNYVYYLDRIRELRF